MTTPEVQEAQKEQIKQTLKAELKHVRTSDDAERVVAQLEQLAAGKTEQSQAQAAVQEHAPPAVAVDRAAAQTAARHAPPTSEAAAVLAETAQQVAAQTREDESALQAAQEVLAPAAVQRETREMPETAWGARLLKQAVLRRLGPVGKLDAGIFLAINSSPHPKWLDTAAHKIALWTNGGWYWAVGVLLARLLSVHGSTRALVEVLPSVALSTFAVEYPLKALFRRRRPFIDVVRALVVGKKPGSWSFPSGHTASAFAGAWVLSTVWPKAAPLFFSVAGMVGFSRIYVGAHYPGDVTSGAFFGMALSELVRRGVLLAVRRYKPEWLAHP